MGPVVAADFRPTPFKICCISKPHIFTAGELSFAHGFFSPGISSEVYGGCSNYDISSCTINQQQELLGDGMSVHAVAAWFTYVVANTVRLDAIKDAQVPLFRSVTMRACVDNDSEEEVEGHLVLGGPAADGHGEFDIA